MSIEHTTRAITENKYMMQIFADKQSLQADLKSLKALKDANPTDPRASDYIIKQKEYELSQIESRTRGKNYASVKSQCEKYFTDNTSLFDKNQIIAETRSMLAKWQTVNEWPHLAAVFLLDHAIVTDEAKAWLATVAPKQEKEFEELIQKLAKPNAESQKSWKNEPTPSNTTTPKEQNTQSQSVAKASKNTVLDTNVPAPWAIKKWPKVTQRSSEWWTDSSGTLGSTSKKVSSTKESNSTLKKSVDTAYNDLIWYTKETDQWFSGLRSSKEDVQNKRKVLSERLANFNTAVRAYLASGGTAEDINWMKLNIAYYYTDDLKGVSSVNQLDVVASQNLCIDILGGNIEKFPTTEDQLYATLETIQTKNPKLGELISKRIAEQQQKWESSNLSVILSNPLIKGGWEKAYDEIYGASNKKLDDELDALKWPKYDTLSGSQQKALDHLRDIRGKGGTFDFTVQNREQMWQMLKYGSAIGAGIVATIPTGGASLGMLALGAWIWATVTTWWTLLAQGYRGSALEVAQEAGINLISFGGGAVLFKVASWAKVAAFAEKTSKALVYGVEWAGNIGIWVGTDTLRARLQNEDLDIWSSLQQNLIWAALPFALRMKWNKVPTEAMNDAEQVNSLIQAANVQAALWKSPKTLLEKIKEPLSRIKSWGEKNNTPVKTDINLEQFRKTHLTGDTLYEKVIKLGGTKKIDIEWLSGYKIGMTEGRTKMEILKPDGKTIQFYQDKLDANISAFYKKEHPVVVSITQPTTTMVEPVATSKTENNIEPVQYREHPAWNTTNSHVDYLVDSNGNTTINKALSKTKTDDSKKPTSDNVSDVQSKRPNDAIKTKTTAESTHIEATTAKNAIHKAEKATIDDAVSASEKQNFITKYGAEKWAALSQSFKDAPKWVWNGAKSIFGVVTGIGRSTVSWKWATIGTAITEVIEASFNLNGTERDWNPMSEDGIKNIWGMLWQILAYRYMGFVRWFIVMEWYRVIPAVYTQVRDANK